jgi:hypothetical protein
MTAWYRAIVIPPSRKQFFIICIFVLWLWRRQNNLKPPRAESRANCISKLVQIVRDELRLHLQCYVCPDAQSHCIIYGYQTADCVFPQFLSWKWSSIILLAWTLGHSTNLIMKSELRYQFAWDDICGSSYSVKSWKITIMQVNAIYISALKGMRLLFLFILLMYLLHSVRALSGEYVCVKCVYFGICVQEYSKMSSFKPNLFENLTQ